MPYFIPIIIKHLRWVESFAPSFFKSCESMIDIIIDLVPKIIDD
jgi:hypothetical protein